ncbi:MAG: flagellar basal body-associated FliL family protein [Alphaproteobacteria bacterium]|nr:flagellar basal body-associated FliL family protein [Alphaproteobacteria bacterium]
MADVSPQSKNKKSSVKGHTKRHYVIVFLLIFIVVAAVLLFFLDNTIGLRKILSPTAHVEDTIKLRKESVNRVIKNRRYLDIEEPISANLYDEQGRPVFLSIKLSFELQAESDREQLQKVIPVIIDSVQAYLRSIRPGELSGTQGIYRVREELVFRINRIASPVAINDVLFKEFLLQ